MNHIGNDKVTPVDLFQIMCIELRTFTAEFIRANHDSIVVMWRDLRADALRSLMPSQQSSTGLGGDLKDKPCLISTPEEISEWCLHLSRRMGINRDFPDKPFYVPPPSLADFARLSLPSTFSIQRTLSSL